MSEPIVEATPVVEETTVSDSLPATPEPDAPLGEPGLKALQAERARAEAAEKQLAELRKADAEAKAAAAEAELSELERAKKDAADAAADAAAARTELRKTRIAAAHDVPVALLPDGDEETVEAAAKALTEWRGAAAGSKREPLVLPLQGNQQESPVIPYHDLFGGK